jgi:hypothetical protein
MIKKIILIFLLLFSCFLSAQNYLINKMSDQNKSFIIFTVKNNNTEVAKICLFDPKKNFNFFSKESDPVFFYDNIERQLEELAKEKNLGKPMCVALGSFEESKNVKKFYPGYFWESLALLVIMPPYFENVNIISTAEKSKRFYLKVTLGDKYFYSLLVTETPLTIKEAKKLFIIIPELNLTEKIKPVPISDFPVKLISFDGDRAKTIYSSDSVKRNYSCLFMAGK